MTKPAAIIHTEKRILIGLLLCCVSLVALYMYFVSATIVHVVVRKEAIKSIAELSSEVAELETAYITAQHTMSESVAAGYGFVAVTEKVFLDRSDSVALSYFRQ